MIGINAQCSYDPLCWGLGVQEILLGLCPDLSTDWAYPPDSCPEPRLIASTRDLLEICLWEPANCGDAGEASPTPMID